MCYNFCMEETGTFFCRGLLALQFVNVCSTDSLVASFVVMGYAGSRPHCLPIPWVLEQTVRLRFTPEGFLTSALLLPPPQGFYCHFCLDSYFVQSVVCLCRVHKFQQRFWECFLNPSVKIDLQKSTGYALYSFMSEQDKLDAILWLAPVRWITLIYLCVYH